MTTPETISRDLKTSTRECNPGACQTSELVNIGFASLYYIPVHQIASCSWHDGEESCK